MDLVIGLLVWGALALLAFRVAVRWLGGGAPSDARRAGDATQPARPAASGSPAPAPASTRPWSSAVLADETMREEEAFVDGAVIGYHLARHYHQRELGELEQELADAELRGGLDDAGFDDAGLDATGLDDAGFDATGFDEAGLDEAGFDEADADDDWGFDDGDEDDDDW
jgi:hypothetical protein